MAARDSSGEARAVAPRRLASPAGDQQFAQQKAEALAERLGRLLGEDLQLTVTNNTRTMLSFRREPSRLLFRAHHIFLDAPPEVVKALADYVRGRSRAAERRISAYLREHEEAVRGARTARQRRELRSQGRVHDLQALFDELNATYFDGRIDAKIGWGREAPNRRRRSIKLGSYLHEARLIRIHPALDRGEVPRFFVRYVVFHEMLHQAVPPERVGGRLQIHSAAFRERERAYPDYERAIAWERENIALLLGPTVPFDPDDPLA